MYLKRAKQSTDPRLRSLLQKATRRGFSEVVTRAFARLELNGDKVWLRSRTVVITFEECWPLAASLAINSDSHTKLKALLAVTKATKYKDAAGLGALAFAYQEGDRSMLDCVPNYDLLKLVSGGLQRPAAFFQWLNGQTKSEQSDRVIRSAQKYLPAATWQWDKACIIAGAVLSIYSDVPEAQPSEESFGDFPYWVALDKHTPQGKVALKEVATSLKTSYRQLIWASFYYESAYSNSLVPSIWWEAEKVWRLRKAGLTPESAEALWAEASILIHNRLENEADLLRKVVSNSLSGSKTQDELFKS